MTDLVHKIFKDFPELNFKSDKRFMWSPSNKTISYDENQLNSNEGISTLFHEISHATLKHVSFKSDLALLQMEVQAWTEAKEIAKTYNIEIQDDYIDSCLESYRDWLYKRSMCMECGTNSLQDKNGLYHCHVCSLKWTVPSSQLCRVQRKKVINKN